MDGIFERLMRHEASMFMFEIINGGDDKDNDDEQNEKHDQSDLSTI